MNEETRENIPMENGNTGAWFNKNNRDMKLIFDPEEQPPEGFVRARPLHGVAYQVYDEAAGQWIADPNAESLERIDGCKAELERLDREAGAGRAVRALALAAAERSGIGGEDFDRLQSLEGEAAALREMIRTAAASSG